MTNRSKQLADAARQAFASHLIQSRTGRSWLLQRPYYGPPEKREHKTASDAMGAPSGWSSTYSTEVICGCHCDLIVTGDIDAVIFQYGPRRALSRVRWMGERHVDDHMDRYVSEKASIGTGRECVFRYDPQHAIEQLGQWLKEEQKECTDTGEVLPHARLCKLQHVIESLAGGCIDDQRQLVEELVGAMGHDYMDDRYDIGMCPTPRVYYAHAALRRLCELLDAKESSQ